MCTTQRFSFAVWKSGVRGHGMHCCSRAMKICLINRELHLNYHQKDIEMTFSLKIFKTKKFLKKFIARHF
jgi:hypothetical protein